MLLYTAIEAKANNRTEIKIETDWQNPKYKYKQKKKGSIDSRLNLKILYSFWGQAHNEKVI